MRNDGIRGIRVGRGDDDVSIRVQGPDLDTLHAIGDQLVDRLRPVSGLRNLHHSSEDIVQELSVVVDRERADVGRAVRVALQGLVVTDYIDGDRQYDVRVRLPQAEMTSPRDVEVILLFPGVDDRPPVYLGDMARVEIVNSPANIRRDRQQRIIEISGTVADATLGEVNSAITQRLSHGC
jgi:multidrug efflux pump subunit AcrB